MKKYTMILALGVVMALTACGSGSAANQKTDSATVSTDTTVKATDSTASGTTTETSVK